jgi:hypothetical protein
MLFKRHYLWFMLAFVLSNVGCAPTINVIIAKQNAGQMKTKIHYEGVKHKQKKYSTNIALSWNVPSDARYDVAAYRVKDGKMNKGKRIFYKKNVKGGAIDFDNKTYTNTELFFVLTPSNKAAETATPDGLTQMVAFRSRDGAISVDIGGKYADKIDGKCDKKTKPYSSIADDLLDILKAIEDTNPTPKSIIFYIDRDKKVQSPEYGSINEAREGIEKWLNSLDYCIKESGEITYEVLELE